MRTWTACGRVAWPTTPSQRATQPTPHETTRRVYAHPVSTAAFMNDDEPREAVSSPAPRPPSRERSRRSQVKAEHKDAVERRERRIAEERRVFSLRNAGLSYRDIAHQLNISIGHVSNILRKAASVEGTPEHVVEFRSRQLARIEDLISSIYVQAKGYTDPQTRLRVPPDLEAQRMIRWWVMEEDRLVGAYAPTQVEVAAGVVVGTSPEDVLARLGQLIDRRQDVSDQRSILAQIEADRAALMAEAANGHGLVIDAEVVDGPPSV